MRCYPSASTNHGVPAPTEGSRLRALNRRVTWTPRTECRTTSPGRTVRAQRREVVVKLRLRLPRAQYRVPMSIGTRSAWTKTTVVLLTGLSTFQVCLASGLPWGRIAYGGQHEGRLPATFRRVSAVAGAAYAGGAVFLASGVGAPAARRKALSALTGLMVVGAGMNLASRSPYERLIWTPVCALTAVSAWRGRATR